MEPFNQRKYLKAGLSAFLPLVLAFAVAGSRE